MTTEKTVKNRDSADAVITITYTSNDNINYRTVQISRFSCRLMLT